MLTRNVNTDVRSGEAVDIFSLKRGNNLIRIRRALGETRPKATHFLVTGRKLLHGWVSYEIIKIWQIGKTGGFSHRTAASHDMWREGDWLRANQNLPLLENSTIYTFALHSAPLTKKALPTKWRRVGWIIQTHFSNEQWEFLQGGMSWILGFSP